jgi:hypothetical protein
VSGYYIGADAGGLLYSFGGSTLCDGTGCDSYFVVRISCAECPVEDEQYQVVIADEDDETTQFQVQPGETLTIPFEQFQLPPDTPIEWLQFQIVAPDGLDDVQFQLIPPAPLSGTPNFQFFSNPPDLLAENYQILLRLTQDESYEQFQTRVSADQDVTQFQFIGAYEVDTDNFQTYSGPVNGEWQFQVVNNGDEPIEFEQFQLIWGTPTTSLTIVGTADPDTGSAPLLTELSWVLGGTGDPYFIYIDWDDGGDVEFYPVDEDVVPHTYSSDGSYEIILRVYDRNGAYAEDTVEVVVSGLGSGTPVTGNAVCGGGGGGDLDPFVDVVYETTLGTGNNLVFFEDFEGISAGSYHLTIEGLDGGNNYFDVHTNACSGTPVGLSTNVSGCHNVTITSSGASFWVGASIGGTAATIRWKLESGSC